MGISIELLQGIEDKDSFVREMEVLKATHAVKQLVLLIDTKLESLSRIDTNNYDNINWSHLQAHNNGMRQAYNHIRKLLTNG